MNFAESVSTCFSKYFVFEGRASRSEYWWFQLLVAPASILSEFVNSVSISYIFLGVFLVCLIPAISAGVRRLHDTNKSGFFLLLGIIPFIGGLILLFFLIPEGTKGTNKYGPNPLSKKTNKRRLKKSRK